MENILRCPFLVLPKSQGLTKVTVRQATPATAPRVGVLLRGGQQRAPAAGAPVSPCPTVSRPLGGRIDLSHIHADGTLTTQGRGSALADWTGSVVRWPVPCPPPRGGFQAPSHSEGVHTPGNGVLEPRGWRAQVAGPISLRREGFCPQHLLR